MIDLIGGIFRHLNDSRLIELGEKRNQENVDKAEREANKISQAEIAAAEIIRTDNNAGDDFLLPPDQR